MCAALSYQYMRPELPAASEDGVAVSKFLDVSELLYDLRVSKASVVLYALYVASKWR